MRSVCNLLRKKNICLHEWAMLLCTGLRKFEGKFIITLNAGWRWLTFSRHWIPCDKNCQYILDSFGIGRLFSAWMIYWCQKYADSDKRRDNDNHCGRLFYTRFWAEISSKRKRKSFSDPPRTQHIFIFWNEKNDINDEDTLDREFPPEKQ